MAQNITLMGASYSAVPSVTLPKTGGGTASFTDVSDTTATAADVASGTYFYTAAGVRTEGTRSGGGGGGGWDVVLKCTNPNDFTSNAADYQWVVGSFDDAVSAFVAKGGVNGYAFSTTFVWDDEEDYGSWNTRILPLTSIGMSSWDITQSNYDTVNLTFKLTSGNTIYSSNMRGAIYTLTVSRNDDPEMTPTYTYQYLH